eukprot:TRINITY_DN20671_c0_g1_i2.p1 TRINITY_DN20671_c0_g1~~TRINITY_DN20671_c0_g1_i2.p1  ORF type:complete len:234 (+),score=2.95 TRINITY_DN20671_c0_g1_i2:437-1138(+)
MSKIGGGKVQSDVNAMVEQPGVLNPLEWGNLVAFPAVSEFPSPIVVATMTAVVMDSNGRSSLLSTGHFIASDSTPNAVIGTNMQNFPIGKLYQVHVGPQTDASLSLLDLTEFNPPSRYHYSPIVVSGNIDPDVAEVGQIAYFPGGISGWQSGRILSIDTTAMIGETIVHNQIEIATHAEDGDSGSPIFVADKQNNTYFIVGILRGGDAANTLACPAIQCIQEMELSQNCLRFS